MTKISNKTLLALIGRKKGLKKSGKILHFCYIVCYNVFMIALNGPLNKKQREKRVL